MLELGKTITFLFWIFLALPQWMNTKTIVLDGQELQRMRQKWEECCHSNLCLGRSCYSVEWRAAAWATVRDHCRGRFADWPFAVDILRVHEEKDIESLWSLLSRANAYPKANSDLPVTVWTSGTRCPEQGPEGLIVSNRWASNHPFPAWLEEKVNETSAEHDKPDDGCKFLVISPETNRTASYDFQDENATHIAICEFLFSGEILRSSTKTVPTTTEVMYNYSSSLSSDLTVEETSTHFSETNSPTFSTLYNTDHETNNYSNSFSSDATVEDTSTHFSEANSQTFSSNYDTDSETSNSNFAFNDSTTYISTSNSFFLSTVTEITMQGTASENYFESTHTVGEFSRETSEESTPLESTAMTTALQATKWTPTNRLTASSTSKDTTNILTAKIETKSFSKPGSTTARFFDGCRGLLVAGIKWPDAGPGETVNQSCPKGMIGYAHWTCNPITKTFVPPRPHIENCRHGWIDNLEKEIAAKNDAVKISSTLAKHTEESILSHGDIKAVVDLSENLMELFQKQERTEMIPNEKRVSNATYNFTKSMVATYSNVLRSKHVNTWQNLPQIHQRRAASSVLRHITCVGQILSCYEVNNDGLQFTVVEENIDLQTFMFKSSTTAHNMHKFPKPVSGINSSSQIILPDNLTLELWPFPCGETKTSVGIIYKQVGNFLPSETSEGSHSNVNSVILSFSFGNSSKSIHLPKDQTVSVILEHMRKLNQNVSIREVPRCVFWNFSRGTYGQWDDSGCSVVYSNTTHTECKCNHLTNFAIIMDVNNVIKKDDPIAEMMTFVCCGISIIALLVTLTFLIGIRSMHCRRSTITANLCFCLLLMNLLIVFGLDRTNNILFCAIIAGILQYTVLSAFCWMLLEGYHLYQKVVSVFSHSSVAYFYAVGYGVPLIIVGITAGLRYEDYGGQDFCWLSKSNNLRWSIAGPACVIILVNVVIFVLTIRSASSLKIKKEQTMSSNAKSWIIGSLSILCLLGLTWIIALFFMIEELHAVSYVFIFLNGLQGVFIFIFHILLNEKANSAFLRFYRKIKRQTSGKRPLNGTSSSSQLRGKLSLGTGVNSSRNTVISRADSRPNSRLSSIMRPTSQSNVGAGITPSPVFHSMMGMERTPSTVHQNVTSVRSRSSDLSIANSKLHSCNSGIFQSRGEPFSRAKAISSTKLKCMSLATHGCNYGGSRNRYLGDKY